MTVTDRTTIRTHPERAVPDEADEILDKGLVAHVGFVVEGRPVVIPMLYHYEDSVVYIHGQRGGRLPRTLRAGDNVCVEVTILDGLIASRHALYHSANYRSAVGFGVAREVTDRDEKEAVLEWMTRRYFPGRTVGEHYSARTPSGRAVSCRSTRPVRSAPPARSADRHAPQFRPHIQFPGPKQ
jgi:nitroimidazol reductase NimA-like FMN-containing flavoprotein (pyridoxamine 5'-phosphate oxidase superfamily)